MRAAKTLRLFGIKSGVDSAEDHPGAAFARDFANFISAKGIPGMNADADDIAALNAFTDPRDSVFHRQ